MTSIDFTRPCPSGDGRSLTSVATVQSRPDGTRIELEVTTAHWKGRGYRASATRQHADGITRRMALTFGADSDSTPLPALEGAPAPGARFNRAVLARLHEQTLRTVNGTAEDWTAWAKDCTAAREK